MTMYASTNAAIGAPNIAITRAITPIKLQETVRAAATGLPIRGRAGRNSSLQLKFTQGDRHRSPSTRGNGYDNVW